MTSASAEERNLRARNLRTVGALAALFMLPLLASFWLYYGSDWRPAARTNHGELMSPARPLPRVTLRDAGGQPAADLFQGKWMLVYIGDGRCDDACRSTLYFMRQTRLGLGDDLTRVDRVFLATGHCCARSFLERNHPDLLVFDASGPEGARLVSVFPQAARPHSIFVTDPLGNLVMRYDAREDPKGLLTDLKKLLKLSHVG